MNCAVCIEQNIVVADWSLEQNQSIEIYLLSV